MGKRLVSQILVVFIFFGVILNRPFLAAYDKDERVDNKIDLISLPPIPSTLEKGVTNAFQGCISAHTNPKQIRFEYERGCKGQICDLVSGSGEIQKFLNLESQSDILQLSSITKPSTCKLYYGYDKYGRLKNCSQHNRDNESVGSFLISRSNDCIEVNAPDGRYVKYYFTSRHESFPVLTLVKRSDGPTLSYEIEDEKYSKSKQGDILGHRDRIIQKNLPDNRFLKTEVLRSSEVVILPQLITTLAPEIALLCSPIRSATAQRGYSETRA
jgi:hypothetical protein